MPGPDDDAQEREIARGYNYPKFGEVPDDATERGVNPAPEHPIAKVQPQSETVGGE